MNPAGVSAFNSKWEWIAVIGILLIAAAFRFLALNDVPPGLHHDEVIIGQEAKDILQGRFAIYFTPGFGHEPLYHYLMAGMFGLIGANAFVLRLTSAFIAMVGLAATYRIIRLIFSPAVALGTIAWMAVSLWPVFFARVGLRSIALPLFATLTAYFLWKALYASRLTYYALAGAFLGLTIYTYQASRVFPIIFAIFFAYLFLLRRLSNRSSSLTRSAHPSSLTWRSIAVFFITATAVATPLILYLTVINPAAEQRIADLAGPLSKLSQGDPSEVLQSTLNTLGMFTFRGDAVPIYNVSGRPVFPEIAGAVLFLLGLLICIRRWKQPAYALMLIWFFIGLLPAMVTPFSPNFVRTIAVWPVPFVFAGLAMVEIVQWAGSRTPHSALRSVPVGFRVPNLLVVFFVLVLTLNAWLTARDYFRDWPSGDYVRYWQQATWTQAVRALNADPSSTPVAASGLSIHDFDPQTFDLLGVRPNLKVKWFDCRNAMLYPQAGSMTRYLAPGFFPCDADLQARYTPNARVIAQPRWPDTGGVIFTLQESDPRAVLAQEPLRQVWIGGESFDPRNPLKDLEPAALPVDLGGLRLLGWTFDRGTVKPGEMIDLFTHWEVAEPISPPLKVFVHITAPDGQIIAQWDGLDVGIGSLEPHDVFVQRHRISLPNDLRGGPYRISAGAYDPDTGVRLKSLLAGHDVDSIVLGMLNVE